MRVFNSPKLIYFRRKYLRPVYLPLFEPLYRNYLLLSQLVLARRITREFNFAINKDPNSTVVVKYDHTCSPPTYGDFFIILMIARFISLSGYKVRFEIIDSNRFGAIWNKLDIGDQDLFVLDQIKLAQKYLNKNCQVIIDGKFSSNSTPSTHGNKSIVPNHVVVYSGEFYRWAPYFLHLLIEKYKWQVPNGFLLKSMREKPVEKFVAWNVRKSKWANYRDTDVASLFKDYLELRTLFPTHSIVILSNQEGLDFAFNNLKRLDTTFSSFLASGRVSAQPNEGYLGAIDWILDSDFYFQRSGGGMGAVAIFSSVPYVMYSIEQTSFFGHHRNKKIAPWSAKNQVFKRLFAKKKTYPISESLQWIAQSY